MPYGYQKDRTVTVMVSELGSESLTQRCMVSRLSMVNWIISGEVVMLEYVFTENISHKIQQWHQSYQPSLDIDK